MTPPTFRRRMVGATIVALALVAFGSTATHAGTTSCGGSATLSAEIGGTSHTYTSSQLCAAADVFNTTYQTRGAPGQANTQDTPQVQQGTSIRALLNAIGVNPGTVQFVDIPRADGTWATLSGGDLANPSDFADGRQPVFVVNGNEIDYYRPLYPGANDTNAADHVQSPSGGQLAIGVHTGPLLSVTATANSSTVTTGAKVTFTAAVSGGAAGSSPYRYSWTFGDGSTGSGKAVEHAFAKTGTFEARASVTGADTSGGVSTPVEITVGTPPKGGQGRGKGSSHQSHHPATGPTHGHGHTAGGAASTHSGAGSPTAGITGLSLPPLPANIGTGHVIKHHKIQPVTPVLAKPPPTVSGRVVSPGIVLSAQQTTIAAKATSPAARIGGNSVEIGTGVATGCGAVALLCIGMVRELRASRHRSARRS